MSENENNKDKKPDAKIRIEVDSKGSDRLAAILEKERAEKEQEKKLNEIEGKDVTSEIGQVLRDKLIQAYADKGHVCPALTSKADYEGAIEILKDLSDKKKPSGSAPMNPDYYQNTPTYDSHGELTKKVYPSYEAMLQDLHDREAVFQGSPKGAEATRMLEAITRKFFEQHKNENSPVPVLQKPLPKLISVNGLLTPEDPSMGDLQERNRIFRRRKIMEREERGSVAVKGEDQ